MENRLSSTPKKKNREKPRKIKDFSAILIFFIDFVAFCEKNHGTPLNIKHSVILKFTYRWYRNQVPKLAKLCS